MSNRLLVAKFAAHLAYLLNDGQDCVEINAFALFHKLNQTLSQAGEDQANSYLYGLVGFGSLPGDFEPEELAQKYFDFVLKRPLRLARSNPFHKGHELFEALCRRGLAAGWADAELVRSLDQTADLPEAGHFPTDFPGVLERLNEIDGHISKGNPAHTTRAQQGPIFLKAGSAAAEVPEELSVWGGIWCAPAKLVKLSQGRAFDAFCSLVIKAVEAANAPYGAFLRAGLSPFDWSEELSTNTVKAIAAFRREIDGQHDLETWRAVWQRRKVPGFASADIFWASDVGRALRNRAVVQRVELDDNMPDPGSFDGELLTEEEFKRCIKARLEDRTLNDFDAWFLNRLAEGAAIGDLAEAPETVERFGGRPSGRELEGYVNDLYERMLTAAHEAKAFAEDSAKIIPITQAGDQTSFKDAEHGL